MDLPAPMIKKLKAYLSLIKPTIILLVVFTGATALVLEGSLSSKPALFLTILVLLFLSAGSANGLNQYLERERDAKMARTRSRRPLPLGQLTPKEALAFSLVIGLISVVTFAVVFNWLSAALTLATIVFYSTFYTLYLKPRTPYNIVIGGAAGAMGPLIGWAAVTGTLSWTPWILFAIIFFWTPPHFWALAICLEDDYRKAKLPMMPNVIGEARTWQKMSVYLYVTFILSLVLFLNNAGWIYLSGAVISGGFFLYQFNRGRRIMKKPETWKVFGYSIAYLLMLFTFMIIDKGFGG